MLYILCIVCSTSQDEDIFIQEDATDSTETSADIAMSAYSMFQRVNLYM